MKIRRIAIVVLISLAYAGPALADRWGSPKRLVAESPARRYQAVVEPAPARNAPGAHLSLWNTRGWFKKQAYERRAVNPLAPVKILVSDHGYVVTLDEHEHAGYEHALVIYDPSGHVVRDSRLDELVGIDDLKKVEATVSSRWWRYLAEPPRISGNDLTLTAVWGEALTISLADGRITRDPELFKNLKRLVQGDLTQLVRLEYERWAGTEHVRCNWRAARSRCESVDRNWKATQIRQARAVGAELRGQLDAVMSLRHLVKSPSYCAWGCTDQQELRFFFVDRGERYSYAVVVRGAEQNQAATALPFAELLRLFKFSGEGTPAK